MYFFRKSVISREENNPYLIRWTIFGCRFFSIKLHKIMLSDEDCLHDHPWTFLSIILSGGYWEWAPLCEKVVSANWHMREKLAFKHMLIGKTKKWYRPGRVLFRPAHYRHRLELPEGKHCWTLVLTGKPFREWGFWTPKGWVEWFKYDPTKENC